MSAVVAVGRRLTVSATTLRDSLSRLLAQCERAHRPSSSDSGGSKRRRVPTGRAGKAGADTLGKILGWNPYVDSGPGTSLPGTQAKGPTGSSGGGSGSSGGGGGGGF